MLAVFAVARDRVEAETLEPQIALESARAALAEREQLLEAVLTTMPAGVALRHVDGSVMDATAFARRDTVAPFPLEGVRAGHGVLPQPAARAKEPGTVPKRAPISTAGNGRPTR